MSSIVDGDRLVLVSAEVPVDRVVVHEMSCVESLSSPFELRLSIQVRGDEPLSTDEIARWMSRPVRALFVGSDVAHGWTGFLREVEYRTDEHAGYQSYSVVVVPLLWHGSLTRRSRAFQELTSTAVVEEVLSGIGLRPGEQLVSRLSGSYPSREYIVQHDESDLDFAQRLMEHDGVFYWFDQQDGGRMVLGDSNAAFSPLDGFEIIGWENRIDAPGESIRQVRRTHRRVPEHVVVRDHNWRRPGTLVQGTAEVDPGGVGIAFSYGEHCGDERDAKRIAAIRAEELRWPRETLVARTTVRGLRPGHRFVLEGHPHPQLDGMELAVVSARHRLVQQALDEGSRIEPYSNDLELIPLDVPYRPARKTPKPRIHGVVHARVDGETASTATPIDAHGRYRLLFPSDVHGKVGGRASRWVRMMQPYAGAGYGMHFPLHIGTEVLVSHVGGDPDRPIIVGAVPNADTTSPVVSGNATQSAIRSHNGILFELEDDAA